MPSGKVCFKSAPALANTATVSMWPPRTANSNGVNPPCDRASRSGARFDQRTGGCRVVFRRRPHQGRLAAPRFRGIDVRAVGQQDSDRAGMTGARRRHQRGLAVRSRRIRIRAGLQQPLDDRRAAVLARQRQRRHPIAIRGGHVRASANQDIDRLEIVTMGRPVERGGAIGLWPVHIDVLLQQRGHRALSPFLTASTS